MLPREVTTVSVDFSALEDAYKSTTLRAREKPAGHFTLQDMMKERGLSRWQANARVLVAIKEGLVEEAGRFGVGSHKLYRFVQSHA